MLFSLCELFLLRFLAALLKESWDWSSQKQATGRFQQSMAVRKSSK
jgi:hypothetical protein